MKYRLIGEVFIRKDFAENDVVHHTEVVEASEGASREELIEISLDGFTEEQEPTWCQGYPLILPEREQRGSSVAGEAELRSTVLLEALPYLEAAQANRFTCESIEYVTGIVTTALNEKGVRVTTREAGKFLADAGYPTRN